LHLFAPVCNHANILKCTRGGQAGVYRHPV
jgi:hypothetical protein